MIPKASRPEHVRENRGALDIALTEDDLTALDLHLPAAKGQELSRYALTALVSLRALGRFDSLATQRPGTQSGREGWPSG